MNDIKWSQWSAMYGMERCGRADLTTIMEWMSNIGKEAAACVKVNEKPHAVYGRKIYNEHDGIEEVRFYRECYMTDDELDATIMASPHDVFYVAHKR